MFQISQGHIHEKQRIVLYYFTLVYEFVSNFEDMEPNMTYGFTHL